MRSLFGFSGNSVHGEFLVHVRVDVANQRGTLAMIALAVSDAGLILKIFML